MTKSRLHPGDPFSYASQFVENPPPETTRGMFQPGDVVTMELEGVGVRRYVVELCDGEAGVSMARLREVDQWPPAWVGWDA